MVHQHFKLVDTLSVIENIVLGIPTKKQKLDLEPAKKRLLELCEEYELYVDPDEIVWKLPAGKQQWVEILKALYRDCKVLVPDRAYRGFDSLLRVISCVMRFVILPPKAVPSFLSSHCKLREVIQITDRVTVIRDGKYIGTVDTKDATQLTLSKMMVGSPGIH